MTFTSKYGPWALVTGAACGLGEEFALQLARRGFDLVLIDVLGQQVEATAAAVRGETGRRVLVLEADLSSESLLDRVGPPTEVR